MDFPSVSVYYLNAASERLSSETCKNSSTATNKQVRKRTIRMLYRLYPIET